jgi:hypothetical protein
VYKKMSNYPCKVCGEQFEYAPLNYRDITTSEDEYKNYEPLEIYYFHGDREGKVCIYQIPKDEEDA